MLSKLDFKNVDDGVAHIVFFKTGEPLVVLKKIIGIINNILIGYWNVSKLKLMNLLVFLNCVKHMVLKFS